MPVSGKKRARKSQEDASKKKAKQEDAAAAAAASVATINNSPVVVGAAATPSLAASPAARKPSPANVSTRNVKSSKMALQQQNDTVGNPYDNESPSVVAPSLADSKKGASHQKKAASTNKKEPRATLNDMTLKSEKSAPVVSKRNPTSVPCILLFLVAILMWCTVALLGLLLSERMDHELHVWQLRNMLHKSEAVGVPLPPQGEELQKKLDSKKMMGNKLQEFGEKLVNLDYME